MYKTGSTQPSWGIWDTELQAWMRGAAGSVAMFDREQAESMCEIKKTLVIKEVFICSKEELTDLRLQLHLQQSDTNLVQMSVKDPSQPRYKITDLMDEMPNGLPRVEGWDQMPSAGLEDV